MKNETWARALLAALLAVPALSGANIGFTGQFATDDQVQLFSFSIGAGKVVTLKSLGYGGGTSTSGSVVPAGGFDTLFTLFEGGGAQIGYFDDDSDCAHSTQFNGVCLDSYYSAFLPAGSYTLALTQSGNFPNGDLPDGFGQQGSGNFTCPQGFCDVFGNQDNGHWAVDVLGADVSTELPEPATPFLTLAGLVPLGVAITHNKKRKREAGR